MTFSLEEPAVGISLGSVTSHVAIVTDSSANEILDEFGCSGMPSCVAFTSNGNLFGEEALQYAKFHPESCVSDFIHLLGQPFSSASTQAHILQGCPNQIYSTGEEDHVVFKVDFDGGDFIAITPEEVCGLILYKLRARAGKFLQRNVTSAVIGVPTVFTSAQREAVFIAARIGGFNESAIRVISCTSASPLTNLLCKTLEPGRFMMSLDVQSTSVSAAVIRVKPYRRETQFDVCMQSGVLQPPGSSFINHIANFIAQDIESKAGVNISSKLEVMWRLIFRCKSLKAELLCNDITSLNISELTPDVPAGLIGSFRQSILNTCSTDLQISITYAIRHALNGLQATQISSLTLSGDCCQVPAVQSLIHHSFPYTAIYSLDNCACGAAIYALNLCADRKPEAIHSSVVVKEKLIYEILGSVIDPADSSRCSFSKSSNLPLQQRWTLKTMQNDQRAISVELSERISTDEDDSIIGRKQFIITGFPDHTRKGSKVVCDISVDDGGLVKLHPKLRLRNGFVDLSVSTNGLFSSNEQISSCIEQTENQCSPQPDMAPIDMSQQVQENAPQSVAESVPEFVIPPEEPQTQESPLTLSFIEILGDPSKHDQAVDEHFLKTHIRAAYVQSVTDALIGHNLVLMSIRQGFIGAPGVCTMESLEWFLQENLYHPASEIKSEEEAHVLDSIFKHAESVGIIRDGYKFRLARTINVRIAERIKAVGAVMKRVGDRVLKMEEDLKSTQARVKYLEEGFEYLSEKQKETQKSIAGLRKSMKDLKDLMKKKERRESYAKIARLVCSFLPTLGPIIAESMGIAASVVDGIKNSGIFDLIQATGEDFINDKLCVDISNFQVVDNMFSERSMAKYPEEARSMIIQSVCLSSGDDMDSFRKSLREHVERTKLDHPACALLDVGTQLWMSQSTARVTRGLSSSSESGLRARSGITDLVRKRFHKEISIRKTDSLTLEDCEDIFDNMFRTYGQSTSSVITPEIVEGAFFETSNSDHVNVSEDCFLQMHQTIWKGLDRNDLVQWVAQMNVNHFEMCARQGQKSTIRMTARAMCSFMSMLVADPTYDVGNVEEVTKWVSDIGKTNEGDVDELSLNDALKEFDDDKNGFIDMVEYINFLERSFNVTLR